MSTKGRRPESSVKVPTYDGVCRSTVYDIVRVWLKVIVTFMLVHALHTYIIHTVHACSCCFSFFQDSSVV